MSKNFPPDSTAIMRVLDAAANRATEGLRVAEDFVRFVLDDRHLTERCKALRHDLVAVLAGLSPPERRAARETLQDVGTTVTTAAEGHREDAADVAAAAWKRAEEAMRSLEEYAKVIDASLASRIEPLRYRAYTLERAVFVTHDMVARLREASLCVLVDGQESADALVALVRPLVAHGAKIIQLRDKTLSDRELVRRGRAVREVTSENDALLVINDRPDVAALARADGVHLGQDDMSIKDARAIVGPRALIGVSTHHLDQARRAVLDGANYLGCGPTFESRTKHFDKLAGLGFLEQVAAEIRLPAFAIGGIMPDNLAEVLATGCRRVAIGGAVLNAEDPAAVVATLARQILNASGRVT